MNTDGTVSIRLHFHSAGRPSVWVTNVTLRALSAYWLTGQSGGQRLSIDVQASHGSRSEMQFMESIHQNIKGSIANRRIGHVK